MCKKINGLLLTAILFSAAFLQAAQTFGQTCTPAPVGLAAWYPADGNALDARSRNNGTLGGTFGHAPTYITGKVGQTFQFDGQSTVGIPDSPSLHITQTLTLEAWINPAAGNSGLLSIIFKGNPNSLVAQPYSLFLDAGDPNNYKFYFRIGNETTATALESPTSLPPNTYTFVTATYDGVTMRIYINGVLDASVTNNFGTLNNTDTNSLVIGNASGNFTGAVDEFSIYNRVLSASEIQAIYNSQGNGKCKPTATVAPTGQIAWFAGDGDARDITGSGNNGTLQGGATFAVGKVGQSFNFSGGGGDYVSTPNIAFGAQATIETWINPSVTTGGYQDGNNVVRRTAAGSLANCRDFGVGLYNGQIGALYAPNSGCTALLASGISPQTNTWYHVVLTIDGSTARLYVNGALAASAATAANYTPDSNFRIGAAQCCSTDAFGGKIDEVSLYSRALSADEIASIVNADLAGKLKQTTTATNTATVGSATVTFSTAANRTVQQIPLNPNLFPALPMGTNSGLTFDIAASVPDSNPKVCLNLPSFTAAQFPNLRIYHFESGVWVNRTGLMDSGTSTLCTAGLTSLSPFAVGMAVPTAAGVEIGGRVLTSKGQGINSVVINLTDTQGKSRSVTTSMFGNYRFTNLKAGETYIVSATAKRFTFGQPTQVVNAVQNLDTLNFTANP